MTTFKKIIIGDDEYRDWGLFWLRVGTGFLMIYNHGWDKLFGGPEKWSKTGILGMKATGIESFPVFFGFIASFSESIAALFIALGLFLRPSSFLLFLTMATATLFHFSSGQGNPEKAMLFGLVCLVLIWVGPGKFSLDYHIFHKEK